ncbi:MAG: pyrrolidone-carboxylate peptidase [Aggregatilineales bacterium]
MTKTILLTGFEPFGKVTENPSQRLIEHFSSVSVPGIKVITQILSVTYDGAGQCICDLTAQHAPDVIIMLGVAQSRPTISLERFALNIDDASIADNAGVLRQGEAIIKEGNQALQSSLPLQKMHDAIATKNIPVRYSNHAGAYVCNHIFYCALYDLKQHNNDIPCGFIHVPSLETISLEQQIVAIEACLKIFA